MEKINYITVNGVRYEIGGSEDLLKPYYMSTGISSLEGGNTKEEIDIALGGNGDSAKITELYEAAKAGNLILLKNDDGVLGGNVIIHSKGSSILLSFHFLKAIGSYSVKFYNLAISKIASTIITSLEVFSVRQS